MKQTRKNISNDNWTTTSVYPRKGISKFKYLNLSTMISTTKHIQQNAKTLLLRFYKLITQNLLNHPERSFFSVLGILFLFIVIGNFIRKPPMIKNPVIPVKAVSVFSVGSAPKLKMTAKIEKSGAIKLVAQTGGVVQGIYATLGQSVSRGSQLFWISTNYQGGTMPTVTREIAQASNKLINDSFDSQKENIQRRRDLANTQYNQFTDLRDISTQSITDTKNLIAFNEQLASSIDTQLNALTVNNADHANDALILQVNQAKSGILSGLLSLKSSLRNVEYQTDSTKATSNLSSLTKDMTLLQLDLEEKSLNLNKEISGLNLTLARINEAMMYPSSPVNGTIERVYVSIGQNISQGTVLATITGNSDSAVAIVSVSKEIAGKISKLEPSTLYIGNDKVELIPKYISREPTEGSFNSIIYSISDEYSSKLTNGSSIVIDIPVGSIGASSIVPYIPLDAIFQTQNEAYLFTATSSGSNALQVESRWVKLGPVYGAFVEVIEGLHKGDQVILDRNVIDGDKITINN
jgi:multidrug efflux pump subunit AcrA (membrane-fusion protein)